MNFPIEQLRLCVLTRHITGTATKDIIHEMTQVHGKDNVPSRSTVYSWIQNIKNGSFELSKGKTAGRLRTVRTPALIDGVKKTMLVLITRFSITALPKCKTVGSEYKIKFFQDTRHR